MTTQAKETLKTALLGAFFGAMVVFALLDLAYKPDLFLSAAIAVVISGLFIIRKILYGVIIK